MTKQQACFGFNVDGQIRTPHLAEPAADAVLQTYGDHPFRIVEFQHVFRAKFDTDAAALAPFTVDRMTLQLLFLCHGFFLFTFALIEENLPTIWSPYLVFEVMSN